MRPALQPGLTSSINAVSEGRERGLSRTRAAGQLARLPPFAHGIVRFKENPARSGGRTGSCPAFQKATSQLHFAARLTWRRSPWANDYPAQATMACAKAIELFAKCTWFAATYVSKLLRLVEFASYFKIVTISLRIVFVLALGASEANFS